MCHLIIEVAYPCSALLACPRREYVVLDPCPAGRIDQPCAFWAIDMAVVRWTHGELCPGCTRQYGGTVAWEVCLWSMDSTNPFDPVAPQVRTRADESRDIDFVDRMMIRALVRRTLAAEAEETDGSEAMDISDGESP
jgi:hypothetical protein